MRLVALIAALLLPIPAYADPGTLALIGKFVSSVAFAGVTYGQIALTIGMAIYGTAQAKRAQRQADAQARAAMDAYNASLKDRAISNIATEAPHVYVYGRARVGSAIVAILTSGSRDEYKHLICVHAAHECDGIEEVYINGKALGTLDENGQVTGGDFFKTSTENGSNTGAGTVVLSNTPLTNTLSLYQEIPDDYDGTTRTLSQISFTQDGLTLTPDPATYQAGAPLVAQYQYTSSSSTIRIGQHLGTSDDTVDAYLHSVLPSEWPATAVLRGLCYTVVTLDLNEPEFQGRPPDVEVLLRGKKLYDPRNDPDVTGEPTISLDFVAREYSIWDGVTTAWSQNAALALYDYLTSELCGVPAADIPLADVITAANVCDEVLDGEATYTINGTVSSGESQAQVLEKMAQSMAGGIVATTWSIWAGKYTAPVLALQQSDIVGSLAITAGASDADIFSGVRGQFISSETAYVATDFKPYQNAAYLAADGRELWTNIDFPFTDSLQRVHNLCRIFTEDQRNGYTVKGQFSLKAWGAQIGQRVTLTSALFGWSAKVFRITDKVFSPSSSIELTLKEDAAEIWDTADAVTPDSTPNTNLPNPFAVAAITSLTCESGTGALLTLEDGSIVSRIIVSWPAIAITKAEIELEWRRVGSDVWQKATVDGSATEAFISPVQDGAFYVVRARGVNTFMSAKSDWTYADTHEVIGKTEPPPDVSAFFISNGALSWPAILGIPDLAGYKIRFHYGRNTAWSNANDLHAGLLTESPWSPELIPSGQLTLLIKAQDTTGNQSLNAATIYADFGDPIVDNIILTYDDQAAGFPGDKTNCTVVGGDLLADDSGDLFWGADSAPHWGPSADPYWPTATYLQAAYIASYTVSEDEAGSRLTLLADIVAASYTLEYRYDTQGDHWGVDGELYWGDDADSFWPAPTDWAAWPGAIDFVPMGEIQFRIVTQAGIVRGAVSQLTLQFDVEDESEILEDVAVLAGGTTLSLTKSYRSIKFVGWTLQDDGGTAVRVDVANKSIAGPLVYCKNDAGTNVTGTSDFIIQGVKG